MKLMRKGGKKADFSQKKVYTDLEAIRSTRFVITVGMITTRCCNQGCSRCRNQSICGKRISGHESRWD